MKNFTTFLSIVAVFCCSTVFAQPHDLGVTMVTIPNAGGQILPGIDLTATIELTNEGTTAIPINTDTFVVNFYVDGVLSSDSPISYWFINQPFAAGATTNIADFDPVNFTSGTHEICASVTLVNGDADTTNDTLCSSYTVITNPDINLAGTSIEAVPDPGMGYDVQDNPSIDELSVDITNVGTTTIPAGIGINYDVYIGTDVSNVVGFLQADLAQNDVTTRTINNTNIIPDLPADTGLFDLCVDVNMTGDLDGTNDVSCTEYLYFDSFDENDSSNWPIGIEENIENQIAVANAYYANNALFVNLISGSNVTDAKLVVMNTAGQEVTTQVINMNGRKRFTERIELGDQAKGVYLIGVYADDALVSRKKVFIQ